MEGNCGGVDVADGVKLALGLVIELGTGHLHPSIIRRTTMKDLDILEHIVETGLCPLDACDICPLSRLKERVETGDFISCYVVIMDEAPPGTCVNEAYRKKAKQVLISIMIELALGGGYEAQ